MKKNHEETAQQRFTCELLVPAGSEEAFLAAVENGADAVYVGGTLFNARAHAHNFNHETMKNAVAYAHRRGVRVHVTMNTLLTDDELMPALKEAEFYYAIGVDALIIQDLGFADLVHQTLPGFSLHQSTQGTAYDLRCVQAAEELGFSRSVLSRELELTEIEKIRRGTDLELEMFVHGALCICYSGQCQMSRYIGGRSGNRGACAQPCRLPYTVLDEHHHRVKTGRHPLSPRDLSLLEDLPKLVRAGVNSLKIEGRMKSPEYVAIVTQLYRKYLDLALSGAPYHVDSSDMEALRQIFNRGGFSEGYIHGKPGRKLMCSGLPKHQGLPVGEVVSRVNQILLDARLNRELQLGDGIEIHSKTLDGGIVTYLKPMKGGLTRIGDFKGQVKPGDAIYRTSSKAQLESARRTFKEVSFTSGKFRRRMPIALELTEQGDSLSLRASVLNGGTGAYDRTFYADVQAISGPFSRSKDNPVSIKRVETALRKTGGTAFEVEELILPEELHLQVKMSELNALRRRVLDELGDRMAAGRDAGGAVVLDTGEAGVMVADADEAAAARLAGEAGGYDRREERAPAADFMMQDHHETYFYSWEAFRKAKVSESATRAVALVPLIEAMQHREEIPDALHVSGFDYLVPYISNVAKGSEAAWIEKHKDAIIEQFKSTGIYIGSLSWIHYFCEDGVPVYADFGLNAYNSRTADVLEKLGASAVMPSLEVYDHSQGAIPLMTLQYRPDGQTLSNHKKDCFTLVKPAFSDQTWVVPDVYEQGEANAIRMKPGNWRVTRSFARPGE